MFIEKILAFNHRRTIIYFRVKERFLQKHLRSESGNNLESVNYMERHSVRQTVLIIYLLAEINGD
jgi:hypothetical protein